jgi:hypothetical protein
MKKLQFLERDYKCPASDDSIDAGKRNLKYYSNLPEELIEEMPIHYQYQHKEKNELVEFLFNPNNILVSYSMYIQGSDSDFLHFAAMAGRNQVTGLTYIDTSGCLIKFLSRGLDDEKNALDIIFGINGNNIITIDLDSAELENGFKRMIFNPTSKYETYFKYEPVDLLGLLK